jgi:hypothetical protein
MRKLMAVIVMASFLFSVSKAGLDDGLVAYWPLNGNAEDSAGSSDLANTGSVTFQTGILNDGATLASSAQKLSCADNSSLSIAGALTFSVWFRLRTTNSTPDYNMLFTKELDGAVSYFGYVTHCSSYGDGKYYFSTYISADGSNTNQVGVDAVNNNTGYLLGTVWHNFVFVFVPSASMTLYLDGISVSSKTTGVPASIYDGSTDFYLGSTGGSPNWFTSHNGSYFDGMIDEARIYNRALSAEEIAQLYVLAAGQVVDVASLPDINSNGYPEIVSLVAEANAGNRLVKIFDGNTSENLKQIYFFNPDWTLKRVFVNDINNDSYQEISVLAVKGNDAQVESRKIIDGFLVKTTVLH